VIVEQNDRRVLGAVRFVDPTTGRWVQEPLLVSAPGCRLVRNRGGAYVLTAVAGLEAHAAAFDAVPATPATGSLSVTVSVADPSGRYLGRRVAIALPRDPDPANADLPMSLFQPVLAPLYPSPTGETAAGAAVLRVSVRRAGAGAGSALLRVLRTSDSLLLARGLTDDRGEALVLVPGIPFMTWDSSGEAVMASETDATITAYHDAAAVAPPDPDDLDARRGALPSVTAPIKLALRREDTVALEIPG
jgi:hypothetical protein